MKPGHRAWLCALFLTLAGMGFAARAQEPMSDAQELTRLYDQYREDFQEVDGSSLYYGGTVEEALKILSTLEHLEETAAKIRPVLVVFSQSYGETAAAVNEALHLAGVSDLGDVGGRYEILAQGVERVESCREASAVQMERKAKLLRSNLDLYTSEMRVRKLNEARGLLKIAVELSPESNELRDRLAEIDYQIAKLDQ